MTQLAARSGDRRVIAKRIYDTLCAHYPDKYVALIQPSDVAEVAPPAPDPAADQAAVGRAKVIGRRLGHDLGFGIGIAQGFCRALNNRL